MPTPRQARKLSRAHFAFMRCLAQGLDERDSWDRYLHLEGEHTDVRTVRRTIARIRDLFAAAAQREQRPGTARLVRLDPRQIGVAAEVTTLEEFAVAEGLEDVAEAEQIEAYAAAYPEADDQRGRAGVPTLFALAERINGIGVRWWLHIPGIGQRKGERILDWMREK